jgi:hypothetical protein
MNTRQAEVDYEKMLEIYQKHEKEIKEKEKQDGQDLVKSIFGSNKIQRRLSDSDSNSDSERQEKLVNSKSSRQTDIGRKRAQDVLTQDSESEPSSKKAQVWNKGIGKLGSKALIVKVKKTKNIDK